MGMREGFGGGTSGRVHDIARYGLLEEHYTPYEYVDEYLYSAPDLVRSVSQGSQVIFA
jgi:hypothetical protein